MTAGGENLESDSLIRALVIQKDGLNRILVEWSGT
jgi:hypothetical protein